MSGRRCRALRAKFFRSTGRPAIRREQRWMKKFYQRHQAMDFYLRATQPDPRAMLERFPQIDSDSVPLTEPEPVSTLETE